MTDTPSPSSAVIPRISQDTVHVMYTDRKGIFWPSTNYGLSRFNPHILTIRNYSIPHPPGMVLDADYQEAVAAVGSGDVLLLQTDGVIEAQDHERNFYGEERLSRVLRSLDMKTLTSRQIRDALLEDVGRFTGSSSQHDDITVVVVKIL